ncbi:polyunsaturated fatty acid lipoxygenase ALOX15B-like [Passerculus sandwichensis]
MTRVFRCFHTPVTEYVVRHWQSDAFFGEQFLSGVNPVLLRRCRRLPPNFPVTGDMVAPSLGTGTDLQREMEVRDPKTPKKPPGDRDGPAAGDGETTPKSIKTTPKSIKITPKSIETTPKLSKPQNHPEFPVTGDMVALSLGTGTDLQREMEAGNIYLADYGVLEGLPTATIDGRPTFVAAPLCLLHQRPDGEMLPLAIQLSQHPGPASPVFVPQDPPWLWALAKAWVRSSEFHVHEGLTHLLRAHLLGEVFALATLRQLPPQHPLFKLLIPHTRFTVQIGALARRFLLNPGGVFDRAVALGRRGLLALVARDLGRWRWAVALGRRGLLALAVALGRRGLLAPCPQSVALGRRGLLAPAVALGRRGLLAPAVALGRRGLLAPAVALGRRGLLALAVALGRRGLLAPAVALGRRGLLALAVALGRRGLLALVARGLRALRWRSLVLPFVASVVSLYYRGDPDVQQDPELQAWVGEIFTRGFLGRRSSGVPSRLDSVRGLVTFVTTVIYTCSAHHAATNSGQVRVTTLSDH